MEEQQTHSALKVHPAADLFPMLPDDEIANLAEDIKVNGQLNPIVIDEANGERVLIDGRNRLKACELLDIEPWIEPLGARDPVALIRSANIERRDLKKGQKAMALAFLYPEADDASERGKKGGRGNKSCSDSEQLSGFSKARLSQARQVLAHSRELALNVLRDVTPLDEALTKVKAERKASESAEAQIAKLRELAPDLADLVADERLKLPEAIAAMEQRQREAEEKEKNRREVMLRITEGAYRDMVSWGNNEFVADIRALVEDQEFRGELIKRVRIDPQFLPNIQRGGAALFDLLSTLTEK
jgi:hypothetical protein